MNYRIYPPEDLLEADVNVPLSKSISNRALIIHALAGNLDFTELPIPDCTDTMAMTEALRNVSDTINVGGAGTAMRFLTAYLAMQHGRSVTLDGDSRMRQRPISVLVNALRKCGATINYEGQEGFPPLRITGAKLSGGTLDIDASVSSQYISALLMVAPYMTDGLIINLSEDFNSLPYIDLTIDIMNRCGAEAERSGRTITVKPGTYRPTVFPSGGDWSAASYWYEIEALTSGFVTLHGLDIASRQGDRAVADIFAKLGVETSAGETPDIVELVASPELSPRLYHDFSDTPDIVQTVAVTCAMLGVPFQFTGLSTLRIKETDRMEALRRELAKVGVAIECTADTMTWNGRRLPITSMPEFDTYGDHRMAMSLAPVSIYIPGIVVRDIEVVEKSYPGFWMNLQAAGFTLTDADCNEPLPDTQP